MQACRFVSTTVCLVIIFHTALSAIFGAETAAENLGRSALVMGNAEYGSRSLEQPVHNARAFADALGAVGFSVELAENLSWREMNAAIQSFGENLTRIGGVGLFYYSGYGIQLDGMNYLLPAGSEITDIGKIRYKAVDAGLVVAQMENSGKSVNIVILDASYGNPVRRTTRDLDSGLACMDAPTGTLIAYATTPGQDAPGLPGKISLYTSELIRQIRIPGQRLVDMFNNVRKSVRTGTGGLQIPLESTSLEAPFFFMNSEYAFVEMPQRVAALGFSGLAEAKFEEVKLAEATVTEASWREPITGMEFVWAQDGCYEMGCGDWASGCQDDEQPVHEVCLNAFRIGKYEVTNRQFVQFLNEAKNRGPAGENWFKTADESVESAILKDSDVYHVRPGFEEHPVVEVSWYGASAFAKWMSQKSGETVKLPTEAQWEYACRSGGKFEDYAGSDDPDTVSWHSGSGVLHPVGMKAPNGLGIHDMSGNVWEWCGDKYSELAYVSHDKTNPVVLRTEPNVGENSSRVIRGGSYRYDPRRGRSTNRGNLWLTGRSPDVGFRVVIESTDQGLSRQTFLARFE